MVVTAFGDGGYRRLAVENDAAGLPTEPVDFGDNGRSLSRGADMALLIIDLDRHIAVHDRNFNAPGSRFERPGAFSLFNDIHWKYAATGVRTALNRRHGSLY